MRFKHCIVDIKRRLVENFKKITRTTGTAKAHWLLERTEILKEKLVYEIQRELQNIIDESYRVYTDELGSFYDKRYVHLCINQ